MENKKGEKKKRKKTRMRRWRKRQNEEDICRLPPYLAVAAHDDGSAPLLTASPSEQSAIMHTHDWSGMLLSLKQKRKQEYYN
ncbi:hypothetical protein M8J75_013587 [Diaphorina citri]|nr:hypothetical protein M8J75_013587 [Diaphorina citri]